MQETLAARPSPDLYDHQDGDNVCFLCGDPKFEVVHKVRHYGFPIVFQRCRCGMIKQTPMPNRSFFEWFFNSDLFVSSRRQAEGRIWGFYDYFKDEPSRLATSRLRYRRLRRHLERAKRPLDILKIGPSTGTFLHTVAQHGHRAYGCDVSNRFVQYAREAYGVEIQQGRFEELGYPAAKFDAILLFNVIENVPNQQQFLLEVRRCLAPGGLFIFNFVDMKHNLLGTIQKERYFLFRPPICYIYDRDVMARMMHRFRFEVVDRYRDVRFMTPEKVFTLLGWRRAHRVARGLRLDQMRIPIYAYPSRIWVAQKPA